ncbi:ATHL1 [Bugula neritina]|nr:ATHL1 [Bugula neritina]
MYVPFDETLKYHPEFDGYDIKNAGHNIVKQADVVLMGFPLCAETSTIVRKNDLELYEKVTTPNGPAMTWSMFCVGHLELNETSRAEPLFDRQLAQCTQPFKVWSEYPNGKGAINFITGMGGFLQSLLFGFLGIRLEPTCLTIKPVLHSHWTRIRLTGASYQGARFDIDVRREVGETSAPGADIVTVVTQTSGDSSQYTITKSQCSDPCVTTFTVRKQTSTC